MKMNRSPRKERPREWHHLVLSSFLYQKCLLHNLFNHACSLADRVLDVEVETCGNIHTESTPGTISAIEKYILHCCRKFIRLFFGWIIDWKVEIDAGDETGRKKVRSELPCEPVAHLLIFYLLFLVQSSASYFALKLSIHGAVMENFHPSTHSSMAPVKEDRIKANKTFKNFFFFFLFSALRALFIFKKTGKGSLLKSKTKKIFTHRTAHNKLLLFFRKERERKTFYQMKFTLLLHFLLIKISLSRLLFPAKTLGEG